MSKRLELVMCFFENGLVNPFMDFVIKSKTHILFGLIELSVDDRLPL